MPSEHTRSSARRRQPQNKKNKHGFRVPAGRHDGGRWIHESSGQVAQAQLALPGLPPAAMAAVAAITAALPLFRWLSAQNSRDKHAILEFNAREYRKTEKGVLDQANARLLSREEVNDACSGYKPVQDITNEEAAKVRATQQGLSPSQYGTAVHKAIKDRIDGLNDPNFQAEVSYLKAQEENGASKDKARYGMKGTIRVDVDEDTQKGTVCVYDIKTGRSGLSKPRVAEIVGRVYARHNPKRIIITEVRPQQ